MKTHSIIIMLFLSVNTLFSQDFDSYYKSATTNRDYTSSINFGNKKILKKDFLNWLQENKQNFYTDVSIREKSKWVYGSLKTFVTDAIFVKDENKYAYVDYLKKLKEQERIQKENDFAIGMGILAIGGYALYKGGEAIYNATKEALTSPSTSSNYSSSGNSDYQVSKKSDNTYVNLNKINGSDNYNYIHIYSNDKESSSGNYFSSIYSLKSEHIKKDYNDSYKDNNGGLTIYNESFPIIVEVSYTSVDGKYIYAQIKINTPGTYNVEVTPN